MNSHDSRQASQTIIDNNNWITNKKSGLIDDKWDIVSESSEINLVQKLGLQPKKDGDQFCFLWGENLQTGIAGFGDTVRDAVLDFNKKYYNEKAETDA